LSKIKSTTDPATAAAESRERLASAQQRKRDADEALAALLAEAEDVRDRARAGEDVDAEALRNTDAAAVELAKLHADGAARRVEAARRGLVAEDTHLGEAVAAAVADLLPGVPVRVATARLTEAPAELPAAVVVQSREAVRDTIEGTLSGTVEVQFWRGPWHRDFPDDRAFDQALDRTQVRATVHRQGRREVGAAVVGTLRVDVRFAWAPVPVLRWQDVRGRAAFRVTSFVGGVGEDARQSRQSHFTGGRGVVIGAGDTGARASTVAVHNRETAVLADRTDSDGRRSITIGTTLVMRPSRGIVWSADDVRDALVSAVEGFEGRCSGGLGRVASARVVNVSPVEGAHPTARAARAEFVLVSQLPEGTTAPGGAASNATPPAPRQATPRRAPVEQSDQFGDVPGRHPGSRR